VRSLASSNINTQFRRLGDNAYKSAVEAGRQVLARSRGVISIDVPPGLDYVADQHVSVMVQDGDAMFVVDVHRDDWIGAIENLDQIPASFNSAHPR
jgi:hypothetical protein